MKPRWVMPALRLSAVCALFALALMVWGVLDPRPFALVVAMSVGQGLGTASFALYMLAVFVDLRHAKVFTALARRFSTNPPDDSSSGSA